MPRRSATTFEDGLSTAEQNLLLGNPAHGRRKTITDDAMTYGRLVVETYCPDNLDEYDDAVADLDPVRERASPMSTIDGAVPVTGEPDDEGTGGIRSVATMAWPALGMLMVASVGSIAQLSDSASFGLGAVTVYLLPALLFLLPVGLVSAELATANRGGIFVWVKDAFGDRTGFQATWFVFMNSVTLYPSLLSFGAAALATAVGRPDLASNGAYMGTVVLVVFWLATFIVSRGMKSSTGISNIGLALGTITPALFLIVFMFAWLIDSKPSQIPFAVSDMVPPVTGLSSIALVVGTFVAFAGLEVNAVHIAHLKGPPKTYLKAVLHGRRHRVHDVPPRLPGHLGGRPRLHARAHVRRLPGLHRLRRRLRHPGPLQRARPVCSWSGPSPPRSRGSAGRAGACGSSGRRATCPAACRRRTRTTCRCRCSSSREPS